MTTAEALKLLQNVRAGRATPSEALRAFQAPPMADLGFAQHSRQVAPGRACAACLYWQPSLKNVVGPANEGREYGNAIPFHSGASDSVPPIPSHLMKSISR